MNGKTAIVIGATGLIGRHLTEMLLENEGYGVVKVFVRRTLGMESPKLEEHLVDFDEIETWKGRLTGDELFSAMGTTRKQAGSKEAQYKVDFGYQYETAKAASENGVDNYFLVSSSGANPGSSSFYLRTKGELEEKIKALPFKRIAFFRPSILQGERSEKRPGEQLGIKFMSGIIRIVPPLRKYRPIHGKVVAHAMIRASERAGEERIEEYTLDQIFEV